MSAPGFRYVSGSAVAVVHDRIAVMLDAAPADPVVARVSALVLAGAGVDDVLDALVTSGLKGLVDFGAFEVRPDGVRMVVRGRVSGSVGALAGVQAEHTMWHDTWQPGCSSAGLAVAGSGDGADLLLGSGVVLAAMVSFGEPAEAGSSAEVEQVEALVSSTASAPAVDAVPPVEPVVVPPTKAVAQPPSEVVETPIAPVEQVVPAEQVIPAEPVASVEPVAPVEPAEPVVDADFAHLFGVTQGPPVLPEQSAAREAAPAVLEVPAQVEEVAEVVEAHSDPSATMATPLTIPPEKLPGRPDAGGAPAATAGLITGMPWLTGADPAAGPANPASVNPTPAQPVPSAPLEVPPPRPAAVAPAPVAAVETTPTPVVAAPSNPASPTEASADRTVNRASLVGRSAVVTVTAIRCAQGHFNPPYAGTCRVCGAPIPPQHPSEIPRPTLGQLRLSTGGVVPLDRPAFLGRNPQVPTGYAAEQPNLVRLPDPDKDVSGQHLEVSLDYWNVLVRDLGSTNGTEVILPGEMPVVLRANDPVIIEPGTRVVMAGTISFIFEVIA